MGSANSLDMDCLVLLAALVYHCKMPDMRQNRQHRPAKYE